MSQAEGMMLMAVVMVMHGYKDDDSDADCKNMPVIPPTHRHRTFIIQMPFTRSPIDSV